MSECQFLLVGEGQYINPRYIISAYRNGDALVIQVEGEIATRRLEGDRGRYVGRYLLAHTPQWAKAKKQP